MSIDFFYRTEEKKPITEEYLRKHLSNEYDVVHLVKNSDGLLEYFSINPVDPSKIVYQNGYEYHLQEDGRYWHPILSRDDDKFEIEHEVLQSIAVDLYMEYEDDL
jgi:hypothetical protein